MRCTIVSLVLALAQPALAERPSPEVKQSVAASMIVAGIVTGVLSVALVVQYSGTSDDSDRRAAGWSAVGISGAAVICGVVALAAPAKPLRRLAVGPTALRVQF